MGGGDEEVGTGIKIKELRVCQPGGRGNKQGQVEEWVVWERGARAGEGKDTGVIKARRCVLASGSSYLLHF